LDSADFVLLDSADFQAALTYQRLLVLTRFVPSSAGRRPTTGLAHWQAIRTRLPSASAL
jgi:hypothetical protein